MCQFVINVDDYTDQGKQDWQNKTMNFTMTDLHNIHASLIFLYTNLRKSHSQMSFKVDEKWNLLNLTSFSYHAKGAHLEGFHNDGYIKSLLFFRAHLLVHSCLLNQFRWFSLHCTTEAHYKCLGYYLSLMALLTELIFFSCPTINQWLRLACIEVLTDAISPRQTDL